MGRSITSTRKEKNLGQPSSQETFSNVVPVAATAAPQETFSDVEPIGGLESVIKKTFAGEPLTPEEQQYTQQLVHSNGKALSESYGRAGQLVLGGGGLQNVAAGEGPSLLKAVYTLPKVKPVVDAALSEALRLPGSKLLQAVLKHWGAPLAEAAGGGIKEVEGTEGAAENAAGEFAPAPEPPKPPQPAAPVTRKQVGAAVDKSLGVEPLKPDVPLREQVSAKAQPVSQAKAESTAISAYRYDADANELHVTSKSNPNTTYVYGDVSADQAAAFDSAPSKGKAWAQFKQGSSPLVAKIVNGKRIPVKPVVSPEDLTTILEESVRRAKSLRDLSGH